MFDGNHNIILKYSTLARVHIFIFAETKYIEELIISLRPNSYKIGIVFAAFQIMREKW